MDHSSDLLVKKRIYVGNLPFDTTEDEIRDKFSNFGNVIQVDMKHRSDSSFDIGLPCFAFLDLKINANRIKSCFQELSQHDWRGNFIKLELARESFLSRLERERTELKQVTSSSDDVPKKAAWSSANIDSTCNVDRSDSSATEPPHRADVAPAANRTKGTPSSEEKKRMKVGKLITVGGQESTVVETKSISSLKEIKRMKVETINTVGDQKAIAVETNGKKTYKEMKRKKIKKDTTTGKLNKQPKKLASEAQRFNALVDRQRCVLQQKDAIRLALASVDQRKTKNRVTFDEDETVESSASFDTRSMNNKPRLFEDDDDGDQASEQKIDFQIKKQFEGRKGQKLLELQSQYANDQRFSLDERFYESDQEDGEGDEKQQQSGNGGEEQVSLSDERRRQIEILQSIVGDHLPRENSTNSRQGDKLMLRFDPTLAEHVQYERKVDNPSSRKESPLEERRRKKKEEKAKKNAPPPTAAVVSKEKFYQVSETLKESLKSTESSGFSLLEMFGTAAEESNEGDKQGVVSAQENDDIQPARNTSNPFRYDSSETEEEDEPPPSTTEPKQPAFASESFFFQRDDLRLQEGVEFFSAKSASADDEGFSRHRRELHMILADKVKHNMRKTSLLTKKKVGGGKLNGSRFRR